MCVVLGHEVVVMLSLRSDMPKIAFNSLKWNWRVLVRGHAALIAHGSNEYLFSREGVTQGDPLSMLFYAVAILPLIESLSDGTIQSWYADDSSCVANLKDLRVWFDKLCDLGPDYGYYPEPSKSFLVIDPSDLQSAQDLFRDTGVQFVSWTSIFGWLRWGLTRIFGVCAI